MAARAGIGDVEILALVESERLRLVDAVRDRPEELRSFPLIDRHRVQRFRPRPRTRVRTRIAVCHVHLRLAVEREVRCPVKIADASRALRAAAIVLGNRDPLRSKIRLIEDVERPRIIDRDLQREVRAVDVAMRNATFAWPVAYDVARVEHAAALRHVKPLRTARCPRRLGTFARSCRAQTKPGRCGAVREQHRARKAKDRAFHLALLLRPERQRDRIAVLIAAK